MTYVLRAGCDVRSVSLDRSVNMVLPCPHGACTGRLGWHDLSNLEEQRE
jgi:hypothetical protein